MSTEVATTASAPGAPVAESRLARDIARRRTFAIISHPDAGKTTLTEKLLLYGGASDASEEERAMLEALGYTEADGG